MHLQSSNEGGKSTLTPEEVQAILYELNLLENRIEAMDPETDWVLANSLGAHATLLWRKYEEHREKGHPPC